MKIHPTLLRLMLAGTFVLIVQGCASVKIHKLNPAGTEVIGPSGMRFYMPRPYVSVFEPFVVDSKPYLVSGRLTADRQFVLIDSVPNELKSRFSAAPNTAGKSVLIPLTDVHVTTPNMGTGGLNAEQLTSSNLVNAASNAVSQASSGNTTSSTNATSSKPQVKGGMLNLKVSNDNQAFAVTPTRRFFDIMWLPDFDEYYVVQGKAGLGNASIAMQMGQGWSLQGLDASSDNSELVKRVYSLYDKSIDLLLKYGTTALGLPPIATGGLQAETLTDPVAKGEIKVGEEITLKITLTRLAAPGVYPILKTSELAVVEKWSDQKRKEVSEGMLVPTPPLNNVAFKTFEVMVVEAVKPVGDSPLNFATYKDLSVPPVQAQAGSSPKATTAPKITPEKLKELGQDLITNLGLHTALVTQDAQGKINVAASIPTGFAKTADETKDAISTRLTPSLNALGVELADKGVSVNQD